MPDVNGGPSTKTRNPHKRSNRGKCCGPRKVPTMPDQRHSTTPRKGRKANERNGSSGSETPAASDAAAPGDLARSRHHALIDQAKPLPPLRTAVVFPVDAVSLAGALDAAAAGLIEPVLIGPTASVRAAASAAKIIQKSFEIVEAETGAEAAERAVALAASGDVGALMKGDLHTDILMEAVISGTPNLKTERRISHVFVLDVPRYPKHLLITDAAINIYPDLETKRDIVQNAIDLAHAIGIEKPRVAILSAVETVTPRIRSTIEAAALCKMTDREQITGAIVDGPLAFDNAVNLKAARIKHIHSPVAGRADVLVVPDLEAGNMLAKQLEYLAGAEAAGVVLGARVPIILTSRADSAKTRLASAAVAVLMRRALTSGDDIGRSWLREAPQP